MCKVICINDANKPEGIKQSNWIEKGEEYTVVKLLRNPIMKTLGFVLEEVQPDSPYKCYLVQRFGVDIDNLEEWCNMFGIKIDVEDIKESINIGELAENI
jgi:hypothetical protein